MRKRFVLWIGILALHAFCWAMFGYHLRKDHEPRPGVVLVDVSPDGQSWFTVDAFNVQPGWVSETYQVNAPFLRVRGPTQ